MKQKTLNIGHRGAKGHIIENTLESIQKAIDLGVDGIELDVHLCRSGELVVFHDFTLDRVTNGSGEISKLSLSDLKKIKVTGGYQIPTLIEVLDLINKKCIVNIELKGLGTAIETCKVVTQYVKNKGWKYDDFIVSSFQKKLIQAVFEYTKIISIGVLTEVDLEDAFQFAKLIKAKAIHPDYTLLTKEHVERIQKEGYKVYTWTVNTVEAIERMKTYGVDGIITDFPERL